MKIMTQNQRDILVGLLIVLLRCIIYSMILVTFPLWFPIYLFVLLFPDMKQDVLKIGQEFRKIGLKSLIW